ncbi:MAG: MlaC/ttg2D family ABC transporter substrate-binding protein [Gammaproteobacteria bacterium]
MKTFRPFTGFILFGLMLGTCAVAAPRPLLDNPKASPSALISQATTQVLGFLKTHRTALRTENRKTVVAMANEVVPYFDFALTSEYVLGRYWQRATPSERTQFQAFFYHYLIHTYAAALRHYHGVRITVIPYRGSTEVHYANVETVIHTRGGQSVHVLYALYRTPQGWRIFDVSVEGISYVMSFRNQFAPILAKVGVAGLVDKLRTHTLGARPGGKD